MRIAHVVSTYPPYYGGMGNVAFQMVSRLAARGHTATALTPSVYEKKELRSAAAPSAFRHAPDLAAHMTSVKHLTPSIRYGNAARLPQIQKELDAYDLVHLHYPFFGTAGMVRAWRDRHPDRALVITYHMDTRAPGWKGLVFAWYARYWMEKILASADLLTVSSFDYLLASDAAAWYRTRPDRWMELPFGVDTKRFFPQEKSPALMGQLQLQSGVPVVLFVGGMDRAHYFKGVPVLLEALALLKNRNMPVHAVFAGDGELRAVYEQRARALRIASLVRFVGFVPDETLPAHYALADVCVLPSVDKGEAFGMVLLEAMGSGVPVIASDLPGMRTVARAGGAVVPPRDPVSLAEMIAAIVFDPAERRALSLQARAAAERVYNWETIIDQLEAAYETALAAAQGRSVY